MGSAWPTELVLLVLHPDTIIIRELLLFRILLFIYIFQGDKINREHVRSSGGSGVAQGLARRQAAGFDSHTAPHLGSAGDYYYPDAKET